jgi:hypothetical protein
MKKKRHTMEIMVKIVIIVILDLDMTFTLLVSKIWNTTSPIHFG